jgi:transcription antitermination factor NusG
MTYHIGQTIPAPPRPRRLQEAAMHAPLWFGFCNLKGGDRAARAQLEADGVTAWFPTKIVHHRIARGPNRTCQVERSVIGGYVFGLFTGFPQWDLLAKKVGQVIAQGGKPYAIPERAMTEMADMPHFLASRMAAIREANTVHPGDMARICDGVAAGWTVQVTAIHNGVARYFIPLLGGRETEIAVDRLQKST